MKTFPITDKTKISRTAKRGDYSEETIYSILNEAVFCHVSYVENGIPMTIPTGYGIIGNNLYLHGSVGSHFMRAISDGRMVCISVSLIDGLVLARSAFHHSVNYRSVVIFEKGTKVEDEKEAWDGVKAITDHFIPNRWNSIREPSESEMRKTMIISFPIVEASAKVRVGGPVDEQADYELPIWAGVLPLKLTVGEPIVDEKLTHNLPVPAHVLEYGHK